MLREIYGAADISIDKKAMKEIKKIEDLGMDIAMRAEAIACTARNLVGSYPVSSRKRMLHTVTDAQGIEVMETEMG